jgi:hypothetical protein
MCHFDFGFFCVFFFTHSYASPGVVLRIGDCQDDRSAKRFLVMNNIHLMYLKIHDGGGRATVGTDPHGL